MQVELLKGTASEAWARAGGVFIPANLVGASILLGLGAARDDDLSKTLRILGGIQVAIAAGNAIGVAATYLARSETIDVPSSTESAPQVAGFRISF